MNFEFNKIAGAVLGTALGVMVVGIVAETIYAPRVSEQPGYVIAVAEPGEGEGEAPAAPEVAPIADRLQTASAEDGEDDVAKCKTCHTFEQGGPNKVGPNLWDVVGHNVIHADFDYSDAMRAKGEEGMEWTFENLDHFIDNPKGFIPGTAMSFAGVKDPGQRADIIAYLRTLSDNPVPLPPPTPAPTAEAPAGEGEQPPATETPPAAGENPPAATESPPAEPPVAEPPAAAPTEEPAAPPATEEPAAPPATEEPAPAPATPPAATPPPPATEQVPPPTTEQPAPAPEPAPPAEDQPAASQPDAQTAPEPAPAPTEAAPPAAEPAPSAPAPDAEADSPEGAPAAEPAQ